MAVRLLEPGPMERRFTCLVVGRSGIGKTSLIRTIPENEAVFVISAESGLLCVRDLVESGDITVAEVENADDVLTVQGWLRKPEYREAYDWVFMDSLSEISDRVSDRCTELYGKDRDQYLQWRMYWEDFKPVIMGFRELGNHYSVVMTCLERIDEDKRKRIRTSPAFATTKARRNIPSYFDEMFYMTDEALPGGGYRRVFMTQPDDYLPGKERSGLLDLTEEPDLAHIRAKILEARSRAADKEA